MATTTQVIVGGTTDQLGTGIEYTAAYGSRIIGGNFSQIRWPAAGNTRHLIGWLSAAPGSGNTRTIQILAGGVVKQTLSFGATDTEAEDTSTKAIARGDAVEIKCNSTGTPAAARLRFAYLWEPTTAGEFVVAGLTDLTQLSSAATQYLPAAGCLPAATSTSADHTIWLPIPVKIYNTHVLLSAKPGVGKRREFQWTHDGALEPNQLVEIRNLAKQGQDITGSFGVQDGGRINLRCITVGNPGAAYASFSAVCKPTQTAEGTTFGSPVKDNGTSTVMATPAIFNADMIGHKMVFDVSGISYPIVSYINPNAVVVTGDASGETDADFTVDGGAPMDHPDLFLISNVSEANLPVAPGGSSAERFRQLLTGGDPWTSDHAQSRAVLHRCQAYRGRFRTTQTPASGAWWVGYNNKLYRFGASITGATTNNEVCDAPKDAGRWDTDMAWVSAYNVPDSIPTNRTKLAMCVAFRMVPALGIVHAGMIDA
ncbi:MAG: hypothetical protein ACYTAN_09775 [Planctomycetota bacterium]|jgi:hypothetical protein